MAESQFILGLDLGQASDYTAIAILERFDPAADAPATQRYRWPSGEAIAEKPKADARPFYHLRHLERPQLGTPYPAIVSRVAEVMDAVPLRGRCHLVVDATGVGVAVVDLLRQAGLRLAAVTITGGDKATRDGSRYSVPKRDLVHTLLVLYQTERLKVAADLTEGPTLIRELLAFKVKSDPVTAHDSYAAWREGAHDDLVLAVAMGAWFGEYALRRVRLLAV